MKLKMNKHLFSRIITLSKENLFKIGEKLEVIKDKEEEAFDNYPENKISGQDEAIQEVIEDIYEVIELLERIY